MKDVCDGAPLTLCAPSCLRIMRLCAVLRFVISFFLCILYFLLVRHIYLFIFLLGHFVMVVRLANYYCLFPRHVPAPPLHPSFSLKVVFLLKKGVCSFVTKDKVGT